MLKLSNIGESQYGRNNYWPVVPTFKKFDKDMDILLNMSNNKLKKHLSLLQQQNFEQYSKLVINSLGVIYSYFYCYKDSPLVDINNSANNLYLSFMQLKLILEDEMINNIIKPQEVPLDVISTVERCCEYLSAYVKENIAVNHQLFNFVAEEITLEQMHEFLFIEVIRNEIVDDEVAMMIPGLQHAMKQVIVSNLWDECGHGIIDNFHTSWLYQLIDSTNSWDKIIKYRENKPWFTSLSSNSFNSLLTNTIGKFQSYGHFLTTEASVKPHFTKIIQGMERLGINNKKISFYFTMHIRIDPHHMNEMLTAMIKNKPSLDSKQLYDIVRGAHQAVAAGELMYSMLLSYFKCQF